MFSDFDFELLKDSEFQEDSVREELILPIIKKLGYSASGDNRVVRSKSLINPLVAIGSKQRKVSIVPDYLFLENGSPYWVLDAKAPTELITKSKHVEQAYSYAIHPEVRAKFYALCNGHEFVLYDIRKFEPIMRFNLREIDEHWDFLYKILNSNEKANSEVLNYKLDYGLFIAKSFSENDLLFMAPFVNSRFFLKAADGLYTTTVEIPGDIATVLTLDFNEHQLEKLLSLQTKEVSYAIKTALSRMPYYILLDDNKVCEFGVTAEFSDQIQENAEESFVPFDVIDFTEFGRLSSE
ncbi:hypothetical protein EA004_19210 [Vibrio anguillarum]|uniref:Type I restriction enzyme R protein N-terminal domain-containing protein n=5 Tax=Vibrio anguillarum TaxID=55601 RepID=A0ABR9Z9X2_VIBAN|nr:type I restriction enzyme HsdR N-terminal domain-containing protein [Vibrio anguillarum]EJL6845500.1 type I restriction enzyme HsdR N-terminal domain-containing protein [Vibrio cholerae]ELN9189167.1 type I restriction enzyme HsdR N-terminal domain-containing protein [Vibrio cholerae]MBF4247114.1 hypothetical protein [Vibrio anguillarum]MBF4375258.1 hypothetical protein [Vibrio anguillarum]